MLSPTDFLTLLSSQPFSPIDVRSFKEFEKGSLPGAKNFPILNDQSRHKVGLTYKQKGPQMAIACGHALVKPEDCVPVWKKHLGQQQLPILFCWRGGLRSKIAQDWLHAKQVPVERIEGGYKGVRNKLLSTLEKPFTGWVLGGYTGSGKTNFLRQLKAPQYSFVDLEALANHKGSTFGALINRKQPCVANFENELAFELYKKRKKHFLFENESKFIGRLYLPKTFFEHFSKLPVIRLHTPLVERIENIYQEYIEKNQQCLTLVQKQCLLALWKLKKRLGDQRYREIAATMSSAFEQQNKSKHFDWIERILKEYYDPCYEFYTKRMRRKEIFLGSKKEVHDFLSFQRS